MTRRFLRWQPNKSHYLHKFLHGNIVCHISTFDDEHWRRVAAYFRAGGKRGQRMKDFLDTMRAYREEDRLKMLLLPRRRQRRRRGAAAAAAAGAAIPDPKKQKTAWGRSLVAAFAKVVEACRFPQQPEGGGDDENPARLFVLDEKVMEYTSDWCFACNLEATNHERNKEHLLGKKSTEDERRQVFQVGASVFVLQVPM